MDEYTSDCVSREAVYDIIIWYGGEDSIKKIDLLDKISKLPRVYPQRKAKWFGADYSNYDESDGKPVYDIWECGYCDSYHEGQEDTLPQYFPCCGSKMSIYKLEDEG